LQFDKASLKISQTILQSYAEFLEKKSEKLLKSVKFVKKVLNYP